LERNSLCSGDSALLTLFFLDGGNIPVLHLVTGSLAAAPQFARCKTLPGATLCGQQMVKRESHACEQEPMMHQSLNPTSHNHQTKKVFMRMLLVVSGQAAVDAALERSLGINV
jgi:hypothetical protein